MTAWGPWDTLEGLVSSTEINKCFADMDLAHHLWTLFTGGHGINLPLPWVTAETSGPWASAGPAFP